MRIGVSGRFTSQTPVRFLGSTFLHCCFSVAASATHARCGTHAPPAEGLRLNVVVGAIAAHHLAEAAAIAPLLFFLVVNHDAEAASFGDEAVVWRVADVTAESV